MLAHDQTRLHVKATENIFTGPVNLLEDSSSFDAYRAPLPAETIVAELTGFGPAADRFAFAELDSRWSALWSGTSDVP